MDSNNFIEYNGIDFNEPKQNFYITEFSNIYNLSEDISELTKISGNITLEYSNLFDNTNLFYVFLINTSVEYTKNNDNFTLSLSEFSTYASSYFALKTSEHTSQIKISIKNIKGKLLSKRKIFIFYSILVSF